MKKSAMLRTFLFSFLGCVTFSSHAWNQSLELGYGYSHDPNNVRYYNSGFLLSGDFYPLRRTEMTFWSLNGALGQWHSSAPTHKNLTTAAINLALRFYPFTVGNNYPAYILGAAGPAYLSDRQFGTNTQGSNVAFQVNAGLGVEVCHFDTNLRFVHYSNAHLANPDHGYNILYLLSFGYLF